MQTIKNALTSLHEHFGFTDFREGQREVIAAILEGKDSVVVMPTGSGKSLCYQLPAMMLEGATVVVSPLIALMKDQVDVLRSRDLPATFINSSIDASEQRRRIDALHRGELKLVYVAPERFRSPRFLEALQSVRIALFAVDEAHCISTWGHDFRPDYLRLKSAIELLNRPQTLALTATATPYVRSDIVQQLGLAAPQVFVSGFDRPNLAIEVVHTEKEREKIARIKRLAKTHDGSGIIYAATRKAVEQVALDLRELGLAVAAYHAGMPDSVRIKAQDDFMSGRVQMIVATNAFGMGIDKADIRFVAHYQFPGSIEAYYQEIGRAGRDGLPSKCVLLFNYADKNTHDFFIEGSYPTIDIVRDVYRGLIATGLKRIDLTAAEIAKRAGIRNEMAVQSAVYQLERAGHLQRIAGSDNRRRHTILLDGGSVGQLRVNPTDLARRGALERRKLREMIEFCYTEDCYRAQILDYFGDHHHPDECGSCGNCAPANEPAPRSADVEGKMSPQLVARRSLTADETIRVRKILSCATRMKGRFGKQMLAATLRGSAAKNVMQARLNELSTYGLLRDMSQESILLCIEQLVAAGCLSISRGAYPTISITELGSRVMREHEQIELALPENERDPVEVEVVPPRTAMQSYRLFSEGLSVSEIASQRNLVTNTIESHLVDCMRSGLSVDTSRLVSAEDREQIEKAIDEHGTDRLKPIHDALQESISYNAIRFVVAEYLLLKKPPVDS